MSSPQLKSNRWIALFAILVMVLLFTACPEVDPPDERERVILIFSDVTSSLVPSESQQVAALTSSIVDSLPPGTRYFIYPVQIEAQKVEPMYEGTILPPDAPLAPTERAAREDKLKHKIEELYNLIKSVKQTSDIHGKPDNHTCILYTLEVAQNKFKQFNQTNTDFELIYVSDMIEECNQTPLGRPISLVQTNMPEAIKLAENTDLKLDLSYANVSMIVPVTIDTYKTRGRPNLSDLRKFWEATLLHCGFTQDTLNNKQKFYFDPGLPLRFQQQN